MSRRRRKRPHSNHERWLVSYADFITLMFAFFVVMYSAAQVDKSRVGRLAVAIQAAFQELGVFPGTAKGIVGRGNEPVALDPVQAIAEAHRKAELRRLVPPAAEDSSKSQNADLLNLRRELEQSLAAEIARREVALRTTPDGLVISLREIGFFDVGSADIRTRSLPAFSRIAELLQQQPYSIRIEGHTDNVPIHNSQFPSNWELSTARAIELVRLLITKYGFAPEQLSAAGYAEYHPIASNATAEGRAQNRRVDLVVLGKPADNSGFPKPSTDGKPSPAIE